MECRISSLNGDVPQWYPMSPTISFLLSHSQKLPLSTSSGIDGNHRRVHEQFRTRRRLYITILEDLALHFLNASKRWQSLYHPPTGQLVWLWRHEKVGMDWGFYDLPWELQPRVFISADCHGSSNQLVSGNTRTEETIKTKKWGK